MKTFLPLLRFPAILVALASLLLTSSPAAEKKADAKKADLQVLVDVPPTWRPFLDDDIADALTARLVEAFRKEGYPGNIVQIRDLSFGDKNVPTLRLYLSEWRIDRIGNAQCTFTASLKTPAGDTDLGLNSGTAMFWPSSIGHWGLNRAFEKADALEDAARNALRDLYKAVAKTGLVAGLETRK